MESNSQFSPEFLLRLREVPEEIIATVKREDLLHEGMIRRLHHCYEPYSGFHLNRKPIFSGKDHYSGLRGYRQIVTILQENGIDIGYHKERELFIEVYRFLATRHALNSIDWDNFENDSLFRLVFPQPGMINAQTVAEYSAAIDEQERQRIVEAYQELTNPHDGKQKLNKPWFMNDDSKLEILEGSQHKYPPVQLIFDKQTQSCFAFCNYCFRHAQVRGDEDMFIQDDISQVIKYLKLHKEISDFLITGGDGGYIPYDRFEQYTRPLLNDPGLFHIRTVRIGSRALTFQPELVLSENFNKHLELFRELKNNGIQVVWMAHFSTPHELLNPITVAAINRLKLYNVNIKSQSPIMKHLSLFVDAEGKTDVDASAQNWIDLGNIFAMLGIGFHSMYCARPTGEHHYFTAPLADINKVFSKVYKTLSSINRPSRYITMTSSAGKISLLGTMEIDGEKLFVLKVNEGRNMDWMDRVYLAHYDEHENTIAKLKPYKTDKHFYEDELVEIEEILEQQLLEAMSHQQ
jgi:lysine 2,3-aminomutase